MTHLIRVAVLGAAFAAAACSKATPDDAASEAVVPVTTADAAIGDVTASIHATGLVTAAPGAELIVVAPEPARVAEMPKAEGDLVRKGDLLVRFEIPSSIAETSKQRAEIARAEARLVTAQATETRMKDLFTRGVAARKDVEDAGRDVADAQADLTTAHAAAEAAETVAARSVVRATFDGIVSKRTHNPGDLVDAGATSPVLQVVDLRRLELTAQIPVADAPRVRVGAPARVKRAESGPAPNLTVVSRPASVQDATATVPVRLAFKSAVDYPVGSLLEVNIEAETHRQVTIVPTAAVVHEGDEAAVFVANGDKAERRVVKVGLDDANGVEILSGVQAGEAVIVTNQNGLPDGAMISVAKP
jgi:RND family efflux transporter MFP subunit